MTNNRLYQGCTYAELILRAIRLWPDRIAIIDRDEEVTYRQLGERIHKTIQALHAAGLNKGDGFGQISANRIDAFVCVAGAFFAGFRYTPMHPLGSEEDHAYVLQNAECKLMVVDADAFRARGAVLTKRVPGLGVLTLGDAEYGENILNTREAYEARLPTPEVGEDDIAMIAYTGGTTGLPKGVVHRQRSLVANLFITLTEWDWPEEIRLLAVAPITHAAGFMILPTLLRGGTVILQPGFDPDAVFSIVERHRITATFFVPTMIYVLLDHPRIREADLSSLQLIIYGAAPMSPTRLKEAIEVFGPIFMQAYGQYEAPNTLIRLPRDLHDPRNLKRLSSCGMPIGNTQLKLLDEADREVPVGQIGEICVRGPLIMDGYWKRPEATAEAFRGEWLHTGDMARRDEDGFVYIVDRKKDMIISGGFNVYPREIEDVLTAHPAVSTAAVIGVPDNHWGEAVKAVVQTKPGAQVTADELIALVREKKGPVYAPKSVDWADEIPITALGKPDKKALRARFWEGRDRQVS